MRVGSGAYSFTISSGEFAFGSLDFAELARIEEEGKQEAKRLSAARSQSVDLDREKLARARDRARELLLSHLSVAQRAEFQTDSTFCVTAPSGSRYRIENNFSRNVLRLDGRGVPIQRFCAHAVVNVPVEDNMLAQKLLLECAEEEFLKKANAGTPEFETRWGPAGPEIVGLGVMIDDVRVAFPRGVRPNVFSAVLDPGGPAIACVLVNGGLAPLAAG
jgi:hypothetical protein